MTTAEHDIIRYARMFPLDVVQAKGNGHAGTASSLAPLMTLLYGSHLRDDPADPGWAGRDRFVLSAGHAALVLYVQLFLSGYGLTLDDLRRTRRLGSLTPGHPERGVTPGVETSTGPLGQGLGNAVGLAMDQRRWQHLLDPDGGTASPFHHTVWCLVGDGDLMEGLSHEAASLAGHLRLGNLVVIWDDNRITIEGGTDVTSSEDVAARFAAYGFRVLEVEDGEDLDALDAALADAAASGPHEAPTFLRVRTRIGHALPTVGGTAAAHAGAPGEDEVRAAKASLGMDPDEHFAMPAALLEAVRAGRAARGAERRAAWEAAFEAWRAEAPAERVALLDRVRAGEPPAHLWDQLPTFDQPTLPIRTATSGYLTALAARLPELWGGSADLADTAGGRLSASDTFLSPSDTSGRPGSVGGSRCTLRRPRTRDGGDQQRHRAGRVVAALRERLPGLRRLPAPLAAARRPHGVAGPVPAHPRLDRRRRGRPHPPAGRARLRAASHPRFGRDPARGRRRGARRPAPRRGGPRGPGGDRVEPAGRSPARPRADLRRGRAAGRVRRAERYPDRDRAAGHRLGGVAGVAAAELLAEAGRRVQVSSLPCWEWFEEQGDAHREAVVRPDVPARIALEAGSGALWWKYVGGHGAVVSVEDFGHSGDGAELMRRAGFTAEHVAEVALTAWQRNGVTGIIRACERPLRDPPGCG